MVKELGGLYSDIELPELFCPQVKIIIKFMLHF